MTIETIERMNELMCDEAVCRTALATPGRLLFE